MTAATRDGLRPGAATRPAGGQAAARAHPPPRSMLRRVHRRSLALPFLFLACSREPAAAAGPSAVIAGFPAASLAEQAAAALRGKREAGHRTGLRIDPPGHHFATFLVVGEIDGQAVGALLDTLAASCIGHVRAQGGTVDAVGAQDLAAVPAAVRRAILGRDVDDAAKGLSRAGGYRVGGRTGHITLLAVQEPYGGSVWRIGGAVHEP